MGQIAQKGALTAIFDFAIAVRLSRMATTGADCARGAQQACPLWRAWGLKRSKREAIAKVAEGALLELATYSRGFCPASIRGEIESSPQIPSDRAPRMSIQFSTKFA
jgi:hypothetical protein